MIEIVNLSKRFGSIVALDNVNLSISRGESFALFGPNGAGKTTLIRILSTLIKPNSGVVKINGFDISEEQEEIKRCIGVVSHNPFLYDELTARENLRFYGDLYGVDADVNALLKEANLRSRGDDLVGTFSRGMKQRLSIARSIIHDPKVLFLDEPSVGLDIKSKRSFYDMINKLVSKGTTILLTTHLLEEAPRLCVKGAVIDRGRVITKVNLKEGTREVEELLSKLG